MYTLQAILLEALCNICSSVCSYLAQNCLTKKVEEEEGEGECWKAETKNVAVKGNVF